MLVYHEHTTGGPADLGKDPCRAKAMEEKPPFKHEHLTTYLDDFLHDIAVLIADITGIQLHMVIALDRSELYF
jgi:hypothetical protein